MFISEAVFSESGEKAEEILELCHVKNPLKY